jgi:hypothetical protein
VLFLGILVLVGAYLSWFYWNRGRTKREAGGADGFGQKTHRRQFGLAEGERLIAHFNAEMYIGPLRPEVGPSSAERLLSAAAGQSYRGALAVIALTDRGRCAIAIEQGDDTELESELADLTDECMGLEPLAVYDRPRPRIQRGEHAFAGHPRYPARGQAPYRAALSGSFARFQLVHVESKHAEPLTIWVEPACVAALMKWAAVAPASDVGRAAQQASGVVPATEGGASKATSQRPDRNGRRWNKASGVFFTTGMIARQKDGT